MRNEWAMPTRKFQNSHYFMDGYLPTTDNVCVYVHQRVMCESAYMSCMCEYALRSSEGEWQVNARNKIKYELKCVNLSRDESECGRCFALKLQSLEVHISVYIAYECLS